MMWSMKFKKLWLHKLWVVLPYGWYGLFLLGPLLTLLTLSFSEFRLSAPPYAPVLQWADHVLQIRISLSNYLIVLGDSFYCTAFMHSLLVAAISTFICLIVGYPMAYSIAQSRYRVVWLMLAILPFFTSFLVRIYAWITLLSPQGLLNHGLWLINCGPLPLINTPIAVIVGMVYSYLPFMILPIYVALQKIDPHIIEAAYDLGCRPYAAFWRIVVPLSRAGIFAGSSLVFIPAVGEYVIPELLGGRQSLTIGRLIWCEFFTNRDWPVAVTLALIMIASLCVPIWIFEKLQNFLEGES